MIEWLSWLYDLVVLEVVMDGVVIDFFSEELIEVLVKVLYVVLYDEVLKNEV